jgi:hypothetical protein
MSSVAPSGGRVSCVYTAATPGIATAAFAAIEAILPRAIVACTSTPYTIPGAESSPAYTTRPVTFSRPSHPGDRLPYQLRRQPFLHSRWDAPLPTQSLLFGKADSTPSNSLAAC